MNNSYTEDVKRSAVEEVVKFGKQESEVAKEFGIREESLHKWVNSEKNREQSSKNLYIAKILETKIKELSEEKNALISVLKILVKELGDEKQ